MQSSLASFQSSKHSNCDPSQRIAPGDWYNGAVLFVQLNSTPDQIAGSGIVIIVVSRNSFVPIRSIWNQILYFITFGYCLYFVLVEFKTTFLQFFWKPQGRSIGNILDTSHPLIILMLLALHRVERPRRSTQTCSRHCYRILWCSILARRSSEIVLVTFKSTEFL